MFTSSKHLTPLQTCFPHPIRYIVECNRDVQPPAYLQRGDLYDLNCIADPEYKEKVLPFHSLEDAAWPKMEELGLDESQMKALQLALTKELAIIQGPPGTGELNLLLEGWLHM